MLPVKGNVIMLAGVPKQLRPPSDVLPRGTASPKPPFVPVTQQLPVQEGWVFVFVFLALGSFF